MVYSTHPGVLGPNRLSGLYFRASMKRSKCTRAFSVNNNKKI